MEGRVENGDDAREVAAILSRAASVGIDPRRVVVALALPLSTLTDFEATIDGSTEQSPEHFPGIRGSLQIDRPGGLPT